MLIYTKKGDKGKTTLYSKNKKTKLSKASLRINVIGSIDEVNSYLGTIVVITKDKELRKTIVKLQDDLFRINAILAGSKMAFTKAKITAIEKRIDRIEKILPRLKNFVFSGGDEVAAKLHYARALVRKAERKTVELSEKELVKPVILIYLNRLSDYIFVVARKVNLDQKTPEEIWEGK